MESLICFSTAQAEFYVFCMQQFATFRASGKCFDEKFSMSSVEKSLLCFRRLSFCLKVEKLLDQVISAFGRFFLPSTG